MEYNTKVIQLALIVACLYTGVGIVRLGWWVGWYARVSNNVQWRVGGCRRQRQQS
jgi:hypothetical protein